MEDKCEQCGVESETAIHALWECAMLDEIWEVVLGFEDRRQYTISNTRDLNNVLHEKRKNLELMAMVIWTIWHQMLFLEHRSSNKLPSLWPFSNKVNNPSVSHQQPLNLSPVLIGVRLSRIALN